jgi:hypothetical protein
VQGGTFTTFDVPGGPAFISSSIINPAGAITGYYNDANFVRHGFLRVPDGTFTTFDAPGSAYATNPAGINPAGAITGSFFDAAGVYHGFLRAPDSILTRPGSTGSCGSQTEDNEPAKPNERDQRAS